MTSRADPGVSPQDLIEKFSAKYGGQRLDWADLTDAHHRGGALRALAAHLVQAASALAVVETELSDLTGWVADNLVIIRAAIDAPAAAPARGLDPDELSRRGPRIGVLAVIRRERITHLQVLLKLWGAHHPAAPHDPDQTDPKATSEGTGPVT